MCFWLLSSWTDAEFTVPYREFTPFLSLGHSVDRKGYLALNSFCPQGGTNGSWPDSWLPHLDRSHEGNLTHSGGVFQRSRCFKIHSLSNGTPIPVPARCNPLWATKDRTQPQFFSEDLMAMHPSPVLAPLHVSVSGNTLLSHRLGTL